MGHLENVDNRAWRDETQELEKSFQGLRKEEVM
jgi:hypothetical protein